MDITAASLPEYAPRRSIGAIYPVLLVTTFLLWPKYISLVAGGISLNPFYLTVLFGLGLLILRMLQRMKIRRFGATTWALIIAALLLWFGRYISSASSPAASGDRVAGTLRELLYGGSLFFIALGFGGYPRALERVAKACLIGSIVFAIIAAIEVVLAVPFAALVQPLIPSSLDDSAMRVLLSEKVRGGVARAGATFSHPIVLGEIAAAIAPLGIWSAFRGDRWLGRIALLCCLATALMTGSRSAQLAMMASIFVYGVAIIVSLPPRKRIITASLFVACMAFVALPMSDYAISLVEGQGDTQSSSFARDLMWQKASPRVDEAPLLGHGQGMDIPYGGLYSDRVSAWTIDDSLLSILINYGWLGVASLGLFTLAALFKAISIEKSSASPNGLAYAFFAGMIAILVGQRATSIQEAYAFFFLVGGLLAARASPKAANYTNGSWL